MYRKSKHTFCVRPLFFFNCAVYDEIMWENTVQPDRPQTALWCTCTACWIPKATSPHSEYVIVLALRLQHWLQECASTFVILTLLVLLKSIYMHENTDECALQMRFISYLTENTVCLYDGAGENMVTPRIMRNPNKCTATAKYRTL